MAYTSKVSADNVRVVDPVNKLRRDTPQIQAPVKAKGPGRQFQTDSGLTALQKLFIVRNRQKDIS